VTLGKPIVCSLQSGDNVVTGYLGLLWLYNFDTQLLMRQVAFEKPIVLSLQS
jgi:hypothetical protein